MPGIPFVISKVPEFDKFEALTEAYTPNDPVIKNAITALQNSAVDLVQEAITFGVYPNSAAAAHFANDWLNKTGTGQWPTFQVNEIIRQGMLKALQEYVASNGRPIEIFWVVASGPAGGPNARWEMTITRGRRQITVMIHTPQYSGVGATAPSTTMWNVRPYPGMGSPITTIPVENPI
jgi:hypothetical protein